MTLGLFGFMPPLRLLYSFRENFLRGWVGVAVTGAGEAVGEDILAV